VLNEMDAQHALRIKPWARGSEWNRLGDMPLLQRGCPAGVWSSVAQRSSIADATISGSA